MAIDLKFTELYIDILKWVSLLLNTVPFGCKEMCGGTVLNSIHVGGVFMKNYEPLDQYKVPGHCLLEMLL